jgi:uncharacterized protein
MDFDFKGRSDLANLLLRTAVREFRDGEMLRVMDFYKCYRAFVRGKVESIQAISTEEAKTEDHAKQAARYFRLALRYAVSGSEPLLLVIMGRVGTGKTTVARQLGSELDWPVFSSDEIRKTLVGVPLTERTAAERRGEVYSERMTEQTYHRLLEKGLSSVEMQGGVVLDATFSSRARREFLRKECEKAHLCLQIVELDANPGEVERRLKARSQRTSQISDARLEDLEKLNAAYESPTEFAAGLIKISANHAVCDSVEAVLLHLSEKQLEQEPSGKSFYSSRKQPSVSTLG